MPLQAGHLIVMLPMASSVPTHFSQIAIMLFRIRKRRNKLLSLPAMPTGNSHVYATANQFFIMPKNVSSLRGLREKWRSEAAIS